MKEQRYTLKEFTAEAETFIAGLFVGKRAMIVALHGDLGAGKTTFVQIIARVLGVAESVVSPTFIIQKRYPLEGQIFSNLIHIDAYRLENIEQLAVLDWEELERDSSNIIFVEWAENVAEILPPETKHIYLKYIDEETRSISYTTYEEKNT